MELTICFDSSESEEWLIEKRTESRCGNKAICLFSIIKCITVSKRFNVFWADNTYVYSVKEEEDTLKKKNVQFMRFFRI